MRPGPDQDAAARPELSPDGTAGHHCGPGCPGSVCGPCVAQLASPSVRLTSLRAAIESEREPLVALTHLLHLCRDEHRVLWAQVSEPSSQARIASVLTTLTGLLAEGSGTAAVIDEPVRRAMAAALESVHGIAPVVLAHALAQFVDQYFGHSFADSFRRRSPYQPGVGDPVPLGNPNLRTIMDMRPTSPPWRLANRLDETRRVRLAGEWAVGFRIVYDYSVLDALAGVINGDTIIATCHPNRSLEEFALPTDRGQPAFPVYPADPDGQRREVNRMIAAATNAGASIVLLPELSVTEQLAFELQGWTCRPGGPQLLVAGSYHHADEHAMTGGAPRRRNTAIGWVRGHHDPLTHDKHSPADQPVAEDIQPDGWPELRVYVTADGWHLVIAICRDLLNPQAVHALTEAGANLVLVPAMSPTLVPFGGPAAQLVGSDQALVAIANNPSQWIDESDGSAERPARALFGHPGFGQQTRLVHSQDLEPGIALLAVRSGQIRWQPTGPPHSAGPLLTDSCVWPEPRWVATLTENLQAPVEPTTGCQPITLRPAAVLVLLTTGPAGPEVLLTQRAPDLGDYPSQLVFPGGAADPSDRGPVATALREAAEEVGLDPAAVRTLGLLPAFALTDSGFLVTPVLAWSARPVFNTTPNPGEVAGMSFISLRDLSCPTADGQRLGHAVVAEPATPESALAPLGRMTGAVIDLLSAILGRGANRAGQERDGASTTPVGDVPTS
jgi:8-oxo-dGTP pyrophosphatase MutT (NUDIX family)